MDFWSAFCQFLADRTQNYLTQNVGHRLWERTYPLWAAEYFSKAGCDSRSFSGNHGFKVRSKDGRLLEHSGLSEDVLADVRMLFQAAGKQKGSSHGDFAMLGRFILEFSSAANNRKGWSVREAVNKVKKDLLLVLAYRLAAAPESMAIFINIASSGLQFCDVCDLENAILSDLLPVQERLKSTDGLRVFKEANTALMIVNPISDIA